jgi:predicted nucleic acid-binding protein
MALAIADAGPLVALFDRKDRYHDWARARVYELRTPLLVCEPVIVEAMYLLRHRPAASDGIFAGLERGALRISFHVEDHVAALRQLHSKYRDRPMSLADACVVRMAEVNEQHAVLTLDSDFTVYRKHGTRPLDLIFPAPQ